MLRSLLPLVVVLGTSLVACAAADEASPGDEGQGGAAESAATASRLYDCTASSDVASRIEVTMTSSTLDVVDVSKDAAPPDGGKVDPTYRPTPSFAGAIRYRGFDKLASTWDEVSTVDFLVSKELQDNPARGKLFMRTSGPEGGGTTAYFCKAKPKKLAVDTSKHSRLNCSLKMLCTHDNPPGDTCLDSAFVNQTEAGSGTLRTTFLDHFGVHVEERNVDAGASTGFHRTANTIKAEWSGNQLDLTYRAGITYLGTLKLPDGRSTEAKCNDLAMLD